MHHDLRDALRALRCAPLFSVVAVSTLALAIGCSTAIFSVIDTVLIRGLPYAAADRVQTVYEQNDDGSIRLPSYPTFKDWQAQSASVRDAIEGFAFIRGDAVSAPGADGPESRAAAYVAPGFFQLVGSRPLLGRGFLPDDEQIGAPPVAVISHAYFMKQFGGDQSVIGTRIPIDSVPTTIIGVMPRGFAYPNFGGGNVWYPPALWQPIAVFQAAHATLTLRALHVDSRAVLRLRAGADPARAAAAMHTIQQRLAAEYPVDQAHWTSVSLRGLSEELFGQLRPTLFFVAGAVGLVLLLACANVANLLLVRSSIRAREIAVRAALGAETWRLARHRLIEAAVIAAGAGVAGAALSAGLVALVRPYADLRLPFATDIAVDARALLFAAGVTALTTLLIGVLPVVHASRDNLVSRLRAGTAPAGGTAERRARDVLVTLQFALALTVLISAGLLIQSVRRVSAVPLGFDDRDVVSFTIAPPDGKYDAPAEAAALYQRIVAAMRAIPSVESAAAAGGALLPTKVETDDRRASAAPPTALYHPISADYLELRRIPVVEGRAFTPDDMRSPSGFLITRNLAKRLWPSTSAINQRITVYRASQGRADFGQPITLPIVGVVADYREYGAEADAPAQVFLPYTLEVWPWMNFVVRTRGGGANVVQAIAPALRQVEPAIVVRAKPSMARASGGASLSDPRTFVAALMTGFAAAALLLAAIGLYGIIAYSVAQRSRELSVRIAVGATSRHIVTLVLRQAARLVVIGMTVGLVASLGATKLVRAMLFQTTTTDVATFILVPLVLTLVAVLASLVPAARAARIDPIVTIRAADL